MELGKYYHVYNRSINQEFLFKEDRNYQFFLDKYKSHLSKHVDTLCYCLMPTHFHLFIRVKEDQVDTQVIEAFRSFFISYAKAINKAYNRTGSLFQHKFKKKVIDDDAYYSAIVAYIHLNPVKAGLAKKPKEWKFSSYETILSDKPTQILREEVLSWFGGREEFERFHESFSQEEISDILKET
ncbi:MAG: transposase [Bacteroidota bacterium]